MASKSLAYNVETVTFGTTFPRYESPSSPRMISASFYCRKVYGREDWGKTLKELGLTPSAVCGLSFGKDFDADVSQVLMAS